MSNPYTTPQSIITTQPGSIGKVRNPGIGLLLVIVTFGIYGLVWGYSTFEEMKNYRKQGVSGVFYLVFSLVPIIAIVGIIFPWLRPAYVGRMYAEDGQARPITGVTGCWVLLPVIGAIILWFKVNNALNTFWLSKGASPA
jgi:hypothetical protein